MSSSMSSNSECADGLPQSLGKTSPLQNILELPGEIKNVSDIRSVVGDDLQAPLGNMPRVEEHFALQHSFSSEEFTKDFGLSRPIALLPPEILCHIFLTALPVPTATPPARPEIGPWRGVWNLFSPWILSHVCQEWRALALSLPTLWTSIVLSTAMLAQEIPVLNIQLARSGNAALDVLIRFTSGYRPSRDPFDLFLLTLIGHCARWRTIQLHFDTGCPAHPAFNELGPIPCLQRLCFSGRGISSLKKYDFFKDAPHLSSVVLSNAGDFSIRDILLPWAQIASYKATYTDGSNHFRNMCASANTLVECDIDFGPDPSAEHIWHGDTLALPRLRRLVTTQDLFLECLVAPALRDLHVCGTTDHILRFLRNSACALTRLTLFMCYAATSDIILILQNTPSVSELRIDFIGPPSAPNQLISALTVHPQLEPLCPNLTSLSWGDRNDYMVRAAFVDMVESRWLIASASALRCRKLRFVAVHLGRLRMKGQGRRLRSFADEGMEVVMLTARKGTQAMETWREY
ncbi:hypothetical protein FB451DRAFT_1282014 [Mycena latifolia]|nr:hypothetical protein FB451DRAFT_1282014 [Mycena latifolia]